MDRKKLERLGSREATEDGCHGTDCISWEEADSATTMATRLVRRPTVQKECLRPQWLGLLGGCLLDNATVVAGSAESRTYIQLPARVNASSTGSRTMR